MDDSSEERSKRKRRSPSDALSNGAGSPPNPPPGQKPETKTFMHHGGPLQQYLARTGGNRESFERALANGDTRAAVLFAAEVLFGEIQRLVWATNEGSSTTEREW